MGPIIGSLASLIGKKRDNPETDNQDEPPAKRQKVEDLPLAPVPINIENVDVTQILQGLINDAGPDDMIKRFSTDHYDDGNNGVKLGGYRQAAYSDSHQEIVKTVGRLSAEDLHILGSASK